MMNENIRQTAIIRRASPDFIRQQPEYKAILSGRNPVSDGQINIHRLPAGGSLVIPGSVRGKSLRTPDVQIKANTTCANITNTSSTAKSIIRSKTATTRHRPVYHQNHTHYNNTHICNTIDVVPFKDSPERRIDTPPPKLSKSLRQSTTLAVVSRVLKRPATCPPSTYSQRSNSEIPETLCSQDTGIKHDKGTHNSCSNKVSLLKIGRTRCLIGRNSQNQQDYSLSVRQDQKDCEQLKISGKGICRTKQSGHLNTNQARDSLQNTHYDSNLMRNRPSTTSLVCQKKTIQIIVTRPKTANVVSKPKSANNNVRTNSVIYGKRQDIQNTISNFQTEKEIYTGFDDVGKQFKVRLEPDEEEPKVDRISGDLEIHASDGEKHAHFHPKIVTNNITDKVCIPIYIDHCNGINRSHNHQNSTESVTTFAVRQENQWENLACRDILCQNSHKTYDVKTDEWNSYQSQENDTKPSKCLNEPILLSSNRSDLQHKLFSQENAAIVSNANKNSGCHDTLTEESELKSTFQCITTNDAKSDPIESEIDFSPTLSGHVSSNRAKTALGLQISPSELEATEDSSDHYSIPNNFRNIRSNDNDELRVPTNKAEKSSSLGPHDIILTDSTESVKSASSQSIPASIRPAITHNKSSPPNTSGYDAKLERSAAYIHAKNKTFSKASQYIKNNHGRGLSILNVHYSQTNTGFNDRIIFADLLKSAHVTNAVIADSVYTMERRLYNRRQDPMRCTTFYDRYMRTRPLSGNEHEHNSSRLGVRRGNKVCRSKSASSLSTSPQSANTNLVTPKHPQTGRKSRGHRTVADKEKARRDRIQKKKERLERGYTPTMETLKSPSPHVIESMLTSCRYLRVQPDKQPWLYEDATTFREVVDVGSDGDEEFFV